MEKLLIEAQLQGEIKDIGNLEVTVDDLYQIVIDMKPNVVTRIQELLPELKTFDCHRLKATILDMKKSGKISDLMAKQEICEETPTKSTRNKSET
jgi:hypothetical protein